MQVIYNPHSMRAKKARFGRVFEKRTNCLFLWMVIIGLIIFGILLPMTDTIVGILLLIPAVLLLMLLLWWYGDLKYLPPRFNGDSEHLLVHEALEKNVLSKLKGEDPSPL